MTTLTFWLKHILIKQSQHLMSRHSKSSLLYLVKQFFSFGFLQDEPGSAVALYHKIVELLADYHDLVDDFVGFLHPHQAQECGKFMDYKYFEKCWSFLRKIDAHHMNRFIHALEQQTTNRTIASETLKTNLLPILKGHQHLSDGFLQLLPDEKPPPCSKEDYEDISETSIEDGDWERLRIPEHPERGCCQNCCCKCHSAPSHPFCISCNIKFINGQIYVQHGKVLRFARVTFGDVPQIEMLKKLHPALYSKRRKERKSSTSKSHNIGNKECGDRNEIPPLEIKCEPHDVANVTVDDCNGVVDIGCGVEERPDDEDDYWGEDSSGGEKSLDSEITSDPDTNDSTRLIGLLTPVSPLANTQDCATPLPKEPYGTEENEQEDLNTSTAETVSNNESLNESSDKCEEEKNIEENKEWTREEDKMILQAFQKEIGTEQTFSKISNLMPSRSMDDIQGRFKVLMSLLEKMATGSQDTYPVS
ncbi:uncharacterized protein isoform X2 [Rhodnius prolixus]|uniref:uncharacterized protein isoform X2 n=1 Tax=Rhodnius prolixus TaxID=13249 RepID=UPI003D18AA36